MPIDTAIALTTNIANVPGVGARRAAAFRKLGIRSVADLIRHLPMRYQHEHEEQSIEEAGALIGPAHGAEANLAIRGEVATARPGQTRRQPFQITLQDGTGTISVLWFNSGWLRRQLHPGTHIRVWGKAQRHDQYLRMVNPKWERVNPEGEEVRGERFAPIYPATESLTSAIIERAVDHVLEPALALLDDHLHDDYRQKRALPPLPDAYRTMHRPTSEDELASARRRLAFDELLMLQLGVMAKRHHRREELTALRLKWNEAIDRHITDRLPFTLTPSQRLVIDEINEDLQSTKPMNRLLQGDVGSGKTVVALYAMLLAVADGHQAALMAPTELLAEQHYTSITEMLHGSRVNIELLTGSRKTKTRAAILERLATGEINLLIGTHALLTETVLFKSLALAVIDEQHRFGVHQRSALRAKGTGEPASATPDPDPGSQNPDRDGAMRAMPLIPHTLVMTATPIPRTMSLTVFGDLDISTISELPPGRQPIVTKHVPMAQAAEVYAYVHQRIGRNKRERSGGSEQAYVVVPAIDESGAGLKDVHSHLEMLARGPLAGRRLAGLHGRLKRHEREAIMDQFRRGTIDVLIATTVIEVGVDVPNASIMIIEHADRFGLAQLHQLRGRVGRGSRKSLCVLIADPITEDGIARLNAIVESTDGFKIAERDLEIRGPGELFGSRQSGLAPFRVADLPRDAKLLQLARRDAKKWIDENPTLTGERDALLKRRLIKTYGEALGLGDVA